MTNIIDRLKMDHDAVDMVLERYDADPTGAANEIKAMLDKHTTMEEEILYPAVKGFDEEMVSHAMEEHDKVDSLINQLVEDPHNMGVYHELKNAIAHHVDEEEKGGGMFDKLREHVDDATLLEMSEKANES